jgi:hypothetical protein
MHESGPEKCPSTFMMLVGNVMVRRKNPYDSDTGASLGITYVFQCLATLGPQDLCLRSARVFAHIAKFRKQYLTCILCKKLPEI